MESKAIASAAIMLIDKYFEQIPMDEMPCGQVKKIYDIYKEKYKHELGGIMAVYYFGKCSRE